MPTRIKTFADGFETDTTPSDSLNASDVIVTPAGNLAATTAQSALEEIQEELDALTDETTAALALKADAATTYADSVVDGMLDDLVDGAPEGLDTLGGLANALNNNPDFATSIASQISGKLNQTDPAMIGVLDAVETETPLPPDVGHRKLYAKGDGWYELDADNVERKVGSDTGSGEKNYIASPDDASQWLASGAGILVETGTTPALLPEQSKKRALAITSETGADYTYSRFSLDAVDRQKKLKVSFNQIYAGASGDYTVEIWANAASDYSGAWTQVSLSRSSVPSGTMSWEATFDSNEAEAYEIRIRGVADALPLYLSGILVGPGRPVPMVAVTEWRSYTPTLKATTLDPTAAHASGRWRRLDDSIELQFAFSLSGRGAGTYYMPLPNGLTVDESKMAGAEGVLNPRLFPLSVEGATGSILYNFADNRIEFIIANAGVTSSIPATLTRVEGSATFPVTEWSGSHVNLLNVDRQSPVRAGIIMPYAGATAPAGWKLCDGSALAQSAYPDLYAAIGNAWGTCRNQETGTNYAAPAAGTFRVPDLRGTFLRGVGTSSGYATTTLAATQDDGTAKNGLSVSGGSYALSGSAPGLTGTTTFASWNHSHAAGPFLYALIHHQGGAIRGLETGTYFNWTDNLSVTVAGTTSSNVWNTGTKVEGFTDTASASATVGITGGGYSLSGSAAALGNGDPETRPVNVGVNYIIKLWNDSADVVGFGRATATSLGLVSGGQVPGSLGTDDAKSGNVGEYLEITGTLSPITSAYVSSSALSLNAGDWDITAVFDAAAGGGSAGAVLVGISTDATASTFSDATGPRYTTGAVSGGGRGGASLPNYRFRTAATTNVYLKVLSYGANFSGVGAYRLSARRIR